MIDFPRLRRSFAGAAGGLARAWRTQQNFRLEVALALGALAVTAWAGVDLVPVVLVSALVLSLELLNTALEALVDLASPEVAPLARVAKDAAGGAVLVAVAAAVIVAVVHVGPAVFGG
jgi:diacylglycerol kinase (ATP)